MHGEGLTVDSRARERAKRTANILNMFVTLDVSKLSGWLNDDASCRVERTAYDRGQEVRPGRRECVQVAHAQREGPESKGWGPGHVWSAPETCRPWL